MPAGIESAPGGSSGNQHPAVRPLAVLQLMKLQLPPLRPMHAHTHIVTLMHAFDERVCMRSRARLADESYTLT